MKKLFGMAAATLLSFDVTTAVISLDVAGVSFPAPVYQFWSCY